MSTNGRPPVLAHGDDLIPGNGKAKLLVLILTALVGTGGFGAWMTAMWQTTTDHTAQIKAIEKDVEATVKRLDRIETKLDKLLEK